MATTARRGIVLAAASALLLSACGGDPEPSPTGTTGGGSSDDGQTGGTLYYLQQSEQFAHLDPQRNYTGEDLAFFSGYLQRTLTSYTYTADEAGSSELIGDLATDTGTANADATEWSFTLRDGLTYEDGSEITCEDVKYGVSRTFATDVITDGPTYAIDLLDIPKDADGASLYKGPYTTDGNDVAAYDSAVSCDGNTITFKLNGPAADFNYTTTLLSFGPVPASADTGEGYDEAPLSSGPYKIGDYTKGQKMTLVRNESWSKDTDPIRMAFPDSIVVEFALDPSAIDQRLIADSGEDETAFSYVLDPTSLAQVFNDPTLEDRRYDGGTIYVRYLAINTQKITNLKQRQAIIAAVDRAALKTIAGGDFAGDLPDGVIPPLLATDYEETGLFTDMLGAEVPDTGDPELAKQLIADSGEPMPAITYDYPSTPTNDKVAAALVESLGKADITVTPNPIEPGQYYPTVQDPTKQNEMSVAGWGYDWPSASTIIPPLFGTGNSFNLSQYSNPEVDAKIAEARAELDRDAQGALWAEINKTAMADATVVPTRLDRQQRLTGSKVGGAYLWTPYGSWPYANLYVIQD